VSVHRLSEFEKGYKTRPSINRNSLRKDFFRLYFPTGRNACLWSPPFTFADILLAISTPTWFLQLKGTVMKKNDNPEHDYLMEEVKLPTKGNIVEVKYDGWYTGKV